MTAAEPVRIDARGLLCPQPVLLLARAAATHPGRQIEVLADDPAAATDIPAWCEMRQAHLVSVTPVAVSPGRDDGPAASGQATAYLVRVSG